MRFRAIPKIQSKLYLGELAKAASSFQKDCIIDFEKRFGEFIGAKFNVAAFSGRAALIAGLKSLGLHQGDEILLPGFTFVGLPHTVKSLGFNPVFVEVEKYSLNIDPDKIEEMISSKTRAMIIVHNLGNPCDMDRINRLCKKHKLILIEDCAHTLGSEFSSKKLGTYGDMAIFSFHYSKIINTIWGGMACTGDSRLALKIKKQISQFNQQKNKEVTARLMVSAAQSFISTPLIYSTAYWWSNRLFTRATGKDIVEYLYQLKPADISYHQKKFTNFQAAIGLEQLKKLDKYNRTRVEYFGLFKKKLDPSVKTQIAHNKALFIPKDIVIFSKNKKRLVANLKKHKIEARDFYIPCLPDMEEYKDERSNCRIAKEIEQEIIYFPTFHYQRKKDIEYIAEKINQSL